MSIGGGIEDGNSPIWSIDYWSNISNLIGVFILGAAVPIAGRIFKRWEKTRLEKEKKQNESTMSLIKGVTDPMEKKLEKMDSTNAAILSNLEKLSTGFEKFAQKQQAVNAKVDYIDKVFQDNIRFGNREIEDRKQEREDNTYRRDKQRDSRRNQKPARYSSYDMDNKDDDSNNDDKTY